MFAILSGWVHRRQQKIIEFYQSQLESMLKAQGKKRILKDEGAEPLLLPPRSPDLNAYIERFFKSLKTEALSRIFFFREKSLRRAVALYLDHYHGERNHQGLGNKIIEPDDEVGSIAGKIECRERLGGFLRYYHRHAA